MAVYIRIVPILEKLRTVLMPQLPYIGHGSLKKASATRASDFFREPWPKYKSFGIVQSLVFPKLGQVLIVQQPMQLNYKV